MTPADLKTARELAATVPMTSVDAEVGAGGNNRFFFSILGLAFVTGLLIVAVATLLASAEAAADQRVLTSVGAGPSIYRSQAAARSGFLTLVGCCLAVPAGLLPAFGMTSILPVLELSVPWTEILIGVVALPITAYVGTWICVRPQVVVFR